jgi:hypothetical protein
MIFLVIPQCLIGRLPKQTVGFVELNSEGALQMEGDATAYGVVTSRGGHKKPKLNTKTELTGTETEYTKIE